MNHCLTGGDLAPEKQCDGQHPLIADGPDFYGAAVLQQDDDRHHPALREIDKVEAVIGSVQDLLER